MENIIYHQVQAENVKDSYSEYDTVDFILSFENRALICNSIRLEGDLLVNSTGSTPITYANDVCIDPKLGAHTLCSSIITQFQNSGLVENLTEYPRSVKMNADATKSDNDMLSGDMVCELRSPHKSISHLQILRKIPKTYGGLRNNNFGRGYRNGVDVAHQLPATSYVNPDFSFKPHICINKVNSPNIRLSYQKSGAIKISITLERKFGVLFGRDVNVNCNYNVRNLRMCFTSAPDNTPNAPITMINTLCLKSSLTSAVSNISSKVPAVCNSMSASFLLQDREYQATFNNNALNEPPNISRLSYMFNDSFNQFVSYEITDRVEILKRGLEGLSSGMSNSQDLTKISSNESFITGLNWGSYIDLSQQKFNVNINSEIVSNEPYIMFMYFHSIINV